MITRLGLIGHGKWGRNIERTLLSLPDVSIITIGRSELLRRDLDGVLIASPSITHADLALPYIEAGVGVFIEKPMATTVADARRIYDAAMRSKAVVFVGHLHLYNPAFLALVGLLPMVGAVQYALSLSENDAPRSDCSVLWDWLPHHLSMARATFGTDPDYVQAWNLSDSVIPYATVSRFVYGKSSWTGMASWLSPVRRFQLTLVAERGTIVFDDRAERKLALHHRSGTISYPDYQKDAPLTRELKCFVETIRNGCVDKSHVNLGFAITRAIAAAEDSIEAGGSNVAVQPLRASPPNRQ